MDHFVILSEQVIDFYIGFESVATNGPFAVDRQVMGVPGLHVVINAILLLAVPFPDIDERVTESVMVTAATGIIEFSHHATAVPRDIWDLMTVIAVTGIGHIDGCVVGVVEPGTQHKTHRQIEGHIGFGIDTVDLDGA